MRCARLGWVEGRDFEIVLRYADRPDQLPVLAAELVRLKVDLILTFGTPATRAAKQATTIIPIVFSLGADPVGSGLVASLARPGGNITGFTTGIYDDKLLEVLKEALPNVSRVACPLSDPGPTILGAARVLGLAVERIAVSAPEDFDRFFTAARKAGAGAAVIVDVAWFGPHFERIAVAAAKSRLPAIGVHRQFVEAGGLLYYGPTPGQNVPRLAFQADRILKGVKPADLPVEQPTKFELIINLKTAKALGITIPPSVLARADGVIQ
jgi:ABC-type uncharacterized transport system substrate-binding protein